MRRTREELCGFLVLITRHWEIPLGQTADVTRAAPEDYLAGLAALLVCACVCVRCRMRVFAKRFPLHCFVCLFTRVSSREGK